LAACLCGKNKNSVCSHKLKKLILRMLGQQAGRHRHEHLRITLVENTVKQMSIQKYRYILCSCTLPPNGTAVMRLTRILEVFRSNPYKRQANMSEIFVRLLMLIHFLKHDTKTCHPTLTLCLLPSPVFSHIAVMPYNLSS
jgi:hypothetical protein